MAEQKAPPLAGRNEAVETVSWPARLEAAATRLMLDGSPAAAASELSILARELRGADCRVCSAAGEAAVDLLTRIQADPEQGTKYLLDLGFTQLQAFFADPGESGKESTSMSFGEDSELIHDFLIEAREHLSQIEGQMLALERDPTAIETIHTVFRAFHTIKGLAGFLDFASIQAVAHEIETLLDLARNGKRAVDGPIVDLVLESGDFLQGELNAIEDALAREAPLTPANNARLVARIRDLIALKPLPPPAYSAQLLQAAETAVDAEPCPANAVEPVMDVSSAQPFELGWPAAPSAKSDHAPQPAPAAMTSAVQQPEAPASMGSEAKSIPVQRNVSDAGSVRVETAKLDHLMNMVGEIVIAQSLIRHNQALASLTDSRLLGDLSQLARVTAEVQRATLSMRMVPVGQLFSRIERVIRDLSRKAGKQIILETSGAETEIDKTVAEELSDPLLHMIRNSVDHGIEAPSERVAAGKHPEARIRLSAFHKGGEIVIAISDDGRGLNAERIRAKAEQRGLVQAGAILAEAEIHNLIFEPGFSTAEQITDISGRGVGMDVVRRNVEKLRGTIETQSALGLGTTFLLKLPLTLAIIDGLVIVLGSEQFIIPISAVREIFRPGVQTLFSVHGREEMVLVRDRLLPVLRLHEQLSVRAGVGTGDPASGLLIVVESSGRHFCIAVDDLVGKQEVVIKSLGGLLENLPALSGCAVLGDGRVGLILDIEGIYRGACR